MGGPNDANVVIIDDDDTCMLLLPPLQTSEVAIGLQLETYRRAANSRIQRLKNKKAADYTLSNASRHVIHFTSRHSHECHLQRELSADFDVRNDILRPLQRHFGHFGRSVGRGRRGVDLSARGAGCDPPEKE